jgi:hypothetical protein
MGFTLLSAAQMALIPLEASSKKVDVGVIAYPYQSTLYKYKTPGLRPGPLFFRNLEGIASVSLSFTEKKKNTWGDCISL